MKSTLWFIHDGNSLLNFVCYLYQNIGIKHFVYIVKRENDIDENLNFRRLIIKSFKNVEILGELDETSKENVFGNFFNLRKIDKNRIIVPDGVTPVFRAGSKFQQFYPPWRNSFTIIHGIGDYMLYGSKNIKKRFYLKIVLRKVFALIDYLIKGRSKFNRNMGKKIAFQLSSDIKNPNYYPISKKNEELKITYSILQTSLNNFVKSRKNKLLTYLPLSINCFQFSKDLNDKDKDKDKDKFFYDFIQYNLDSINALKTKLNEDFSIFIQPHPADIFCPIKRRLIYSKFLKVLINKLKERYGAVNYIGEFVSSEIGYECPYELVEFFLKPDFLLSCYPSAALISSQLKNNKKFCVDQNNKLFRNLSNRNYDSIFVNKGNNNLYKVIKLKEN